jgi:integrase/recombinase XerD
LERGSHHPRPKKPQKLPIVLSPEEVRHFLGCVASPKHGTIVTTCYAAGLRVSEVVRLKPTDIDRSAHGIRVEQGKGQKDCYVMLSPKLLEMLREWWRLAKPKLWLFPGKRPDRHVTRFAVERRARKHIEPPASPTRHPALDETHVRSASA